MKKDSNPEDAHKCAKWAWIGFAVSAVIFIIYFIAMGSVIGRYY